VGFATKPKLATTMIRRAPDAGVPASWVAGDEVHGADPRRRAELQARQLGEVLAVACHHRVGLGGSTCRVDELHTAGPGQGVAAGVGRSGRQGPPPGRLGGCAPGPRWSPPANQAGRHWLLVRRNRATGELALSRCCTPRPTPLAVLVKVAGRRWTIQERSPDRQGPVRPGPAPGSPLHCWDRWVTLAMVAHAFLVVAGLAERRRAPASPELIEGSGNQVSRLFAVLVARPPGDHAHRLAWSRWQRRHQMRARTCHHRRQAAQHP
jgi:hypothetical protein